MTIIVDDAGSGDLLFGVVLGAYRLETREFRYGVVSVQYFQSPRFHRKEYLKAASKIVFQLLDEFNLKRGEPVKICKGYIFDKAVQDLQERFSDSPIDRIKVTGEPQRLTEMAYLDEIRNLGYEPLKEREGKRAKSFFHMLRWLRDNPDQLKYAKTGWPRLAKYRLFRSTKMRVARDSEKPRTSSIH